MIDPTQIRNWSVILPAAVGDSLVSLPAIWTLAMATRGAPKSIFVNAAALSMFRRWSIPDVVCHSYEEFGASDDRECTAIIDFRSTPESIERSMTLCPQNFICHGFGDVQLGHHYVVNGEILPALTFGPGWESAWRNDANEPCDSAWDFDAGLLLRALGMERHHRSMQDAFEQMIRERRPEIGSDDRLVVLIPGRGSDARQWGDGRWSELSERLIVRGLDVVMILGPEDRDPLPPENVCKRVRGLSLADVAAVCEKSGCVISVDCGGMHVAGAHGSRVVSIWGPTNERIWFPYRSEQRMALRRGIRNLDVNGGIQSIDSWMQWPCPAEVEMASLNVLKGNGYVADL